MQLFPIDIGMHYFLTLKEWRRFLDNLEEVRRQKFDERFLRMWDYYLAYCEGAFRSVTSATPDWRSENRE